MQLQAEVTNDHYCVYRPFPTVVMSKKDEQLIKEGDDLEEEDKYSVAVMDMNPIYEVDPDEKVGTVAYHKSGQDDDDDDQEELVKVCLCPITKIIIL